MMKKVLSMILSICLLLSTLLFTGCSESDIAAVQEYQSLEYNWETIFTSTVDNETLTISRRHEEGSLGVHNTYFKITTYVSGYCTYFYTSMPVPCKNGFLTCDNTPADLADACSQDELIEALYPYVQAVVANEITQKLLDASLTTEEIKDLLFNDMVLDWFEGQKDDILSEVNTSALGILSSGNEYISMAIELVFAIDDGMDVQENTQDQNSFIEFLMPSLPQIKQNFEKVLLFFGIKNAEANTVLQSLAGEYAATPADQYHALFYDVKKELHDNFKRLVDERPSVGEQFRDLFP